MVLVADFSDGCHALPVDQTHFSGRQPECNVAPLLCDDGCAAASRTRHLAAFAEVELDVMDGNTERNLVKRHRIAYIEGRL